MRFKIDENLPAELRDDLRVAGHEADTVSDQGLAGASDPHLVERVYSEGRVLFTMDKGIADVRIFEPGHQSAVVLFRPPTAG